MDERQTVDQNGHIVARIVLALGFLVLIDDLQAVVVNILFIYELDILRSSVIPVKHLDMIRLDG